LGSVRITSRVSSDHVARAVQAQRQRRDRLAIVRRRELHADAGLAARSERIAHAQVVFVSSATARPRRTQGRNW